jgi:hypothetical protein
LLQLFSADEFVADRELRREGAHLAVVCAHDATAGLDRGLELFERGESRIDSPFGQVFSCAIGALDRSFDPERCTILAGSMHDTPANPLDKVTTVVHLTTKSLVYRDGCASGTRCWLVLCARACRLGLRSTMHDRRARTRHGRRKERARSER